MTRPCGSAELIDVVTAPTERPAPLTALNAALSLSPTRFGIGIVVPARRISTTAKFHRSATGALAPTVTLPVELTGPADWTQNVSPAPASVHSCTEDWPESSVRATLASQSLPTPKMSEPGRVVVSGRAVAPDGAEAAALAPMPDELRNPTTVSD